MNDEIKQLKDCSEFKKLTRALAEWMVLIELCKDLIARIETYELSVFIDAILLNQQIEKGWVLDH